MLEPGEMDSVLTGGAAKAGDVVFITRSAGAPGIAFGDCPVEQVEQTMIDGRWLPGLGYVRTA